MARSDSARDRLTGLPGRPAFDKALAGRLAAGLPTALLLIDIDNFASFNAEHGQADGDQALMLIAERLRGLVPDHLARLGDDEFGVLLEIVPGCECVEALSQRIVRAMATGRGRAAQPCSVSVGVALSPAHAHDAGGMLRAAHTALAQAKSEGGGLWRVHDSAREAARQTRTLMKHELSEAIAGGQIVPFYQPIVELQRENGPEEGAYRLVGLEVLARWEHPTRGLLPPDIFIPMAEEARLCGQLTESLMRRVIAESREWPSWLYFAFNVSPGQLRDLIGFIQAPPAWPEGALDARRLEMEITESALIEDLEVAREVLGLLQARGTRVVLDDFGIGYSNFFHLRELPFDRIKIDRSFVQDIESDPRADACVRAMLALGQSLGAEMVAEGIETSRVARYLAGLGCRYGQGFFFSTPVRAAGVPALLCKDGVGTCQGPARQTALH